MSKNALGADLLQVNELSVQYNTEAVACGGHQHGTPSCLAPGQNYWYKQFDTQVATFFFLPWTRQNFQEKNSSYNQRNLSFVVALNQQGSQFMYETGCCISLLAFISSTAHQGAKASDRNGNSSILLSFTLQIPIQSINLSQTFAVQDAITRTKLLQI